MKRYPLILLLFLAGCKDQQPEENKFTTDIQELQTYFRIPGIAAIVTKHNKVIYENYFGYADLRNAVPVDSTTVFPMASLTKMFSGYVMLQHPETFEEPINKYIFDPPIGDSVKVKHVLSHTSQGEVGKHFYYSSRFSFLTKVIEATTGGTFENAVQKSIIAPYGLTHTFLLGDSTDLEGKPVAMPYVIGFERIEPGFFDYGFSSSSGITSTVRDIAKFGKVINKMPKGQYDYGYFKQVVGVDTVLWAYGQYDCYSSLFIKVPSRDLILVMSANNSLMSDPARLIFGDVRTSLFALSFFRNFMHVNLPYEELKAKAVAASFLGMYDSASMEKSKKLLREVFKGDDYTSLTTMHNIRIFSEIAYYQNRPRVDEFDTQLVSIGRTLLAEDINNPYANIYLANHYDSKKEPDSARIFYRRVADAKNFAPNWYTREAESWLKQHGSSAQGIASRQLR